MNRVKCLVHGEHWTDAGAECQRCLAMEQASETDIKPEYDFSRATLAFDREKLKTEGRKDDQEKPDLSLLPREFLEEVARAFMHGEKKYGRYNYLNGMDWHRLIAATFRHISSFNNGEDLDTESGYSHLGHAGACIAMLLVYKAQGLGKDTRHKK